MRLQVNGESRDIAGVETVGDLLRVLGIEPGRVAVEVNQEVVPRARIATHPVQAEDHVEIVSFVGGGR